MKNIVNDTKVGYSLEHVAVTMSVRTRVLLTMTMTALDPANSLWHILTNPADIPLSRQLEFCEYSIGWQRPPVVANSSATRAASHTES